MKKILFTLAIVISGFAFSQTAKTPLVLVDGAITSEAFMKTIDTKKIESVNVYKNSVPDYLKSLEGAAAKGIVDVKLKEPMFDRISLGELNTQYKLPAKNPVSFDGTIFNDTKLQVISNALINMKVNTVDGREILFLNTTSKK